ncbi:MAG: hypothetical protein JNM19_05945 [Chitinophagaceae bacterium]|nr:hypothetical protein [Chitinophagaceae bacterium]
MRKIIFLLLACPVLASAQRKEWDIAFLKSIPDSLTQPIHMPPRDYNPTFSYDDNISYGQKSRVFVVTSDSVYHQLFWRYIYTQDSLAKYKRTDGDQWWYNWMVTHLVDSLPVIDFSKKELLMYAACAQCFAYCNHGQGEDNCHRNACNFRETWFIRDKRRSN